MEINTLRKSTYGFAELVVMFGYSLMLWINLFEQGITYLIIVDCVILASAIISVIWMKLFKQKARVYLIVNCIRYFLVLLLVLLSNLSVIFGESEYPEYRLIIPTMVAIFFIVYYYKKESEQWAEVLKTWQKIGKIDFQDKMFKIGVPNYLMTKGGEENVKKFATFYVAGWFVLSLLNLFWGAGIKYFILTLGSLLGAYVFSMGIGKFAAWMVCFIKMEKEMQVEFVTEYGDAKKLARLSRKKR